MKVEATLGVWSHQDADGKQTKRVVQGEVSYCHQVAEDTSCIALKNKATNFLKLLAFPKRRSPSDDLQR